MARKTKISLQGSQEKWKLVERLSWDLFHMMLFDSASTWVNTCLHQLWLEPEISELETGCTCMWPRELRVVLTLDSGRSERWSWQHATRLCCLQILPAFMYRQSWWRDGDLDLQVFLPYLLLIGNVLNMRNLRTGPCGSTFFKSHAFMEHVWEQTDSVANAWEALRKTFETTDGACKGTRKL